MDIYRGTREVGEHLLRDARRVSPASAALQHRPRLRGQLTDPTGDSHGYGARRVPDVHPRHRQRQPAGDGRAYATFGPAAAATPHPVTSIDDARGSEIRAYEEQLPANTAGDRRRRQRRAPWRPGPGGFGYDLGGTGLGVPSAGKTGTTQDGKSVVVRRLHPQIATAAMIAGASRTASSRSRSPARPSTAPHLLRHRFRLPGPDVGRAMHVVDDRLKYEDFTAPSATAVRGVPTTVPSVPACRSTPR